METVGASEDDSTALLALTEPSCSCGERPNSEEDAFSQKEEHTARSIAVLHLYNISSQRTGNFRKKDICDRREL